MPSPLLSVARIRPATIVHAGPSHRATISSVTFRPFCSRWSWTGSSEIRDADAEAALQARIDDVRGDIVGGLEAIHHA
jgi:hypothetical protein